MARRAGDATPHGDQRPITVDEMRAPAEAVDVAPAHLAATEEAIVGAAWADYHQELYAFLVRTVRDPDSAEDLLQESFLRLTRQIRSGGTPDNIRAWLYRVAANLAVSRGRRISAGLRGLMRLGGRATSSRSDDLPEARYLEREGRQELVAVLEQLGPDARAALLLSGEGYTGAEIAAAIGRSPLATRTLLCRTRIRVRQGLEARELVP